MLRISFAFHDNKMEYEAETGDDYERFEVEDEEVEDQRYISEIPEKEEEEGERNASRFSPGTSRKYEKEEEEGERNF